MPAVSKELKEERRAQGLCVYCGRPAVIKRDGKPGTYKYELLLSLWTKIMVE